MIGTKVLVLLLWIGASSSQQCAQNLVPDYSGVQSTERYEYARFADLPGFTRSVYKPNYALVTPESRVWSTAPGWSKSQLAHLISKSSGAHFSMYLVNMQAGGAANHPSPSIERFVFVLGGQALIAGCVSKGETNARISLAANHYAFFPDAKSVPECVEAASLTAATDTHLLIYERQYSGSGGKLKPHFLHGFVEDSPLLDTGIEMFALRKLLPQSVEFDFNIHIMDFQPGEHLVVKEVHYNQHGLLLLQGKGIYRLADDWHPVQAGDAIWMAPYVPQWFAALGHEPARYIIYKDVHNDPLLV